MILLFFKRLSYTFLHLKQVMLEILQIFYQTNMLTFKYKKKKKKKAVHGQTKNKPVIEVNHEHI